MYLEGLSLGTAQRGEARRGEERRGEARRGEERRGEARRGEARREEERRGSEAVTSCHGPVPHDTARLGLAEKVRRRAAPQHVVDHDRELDRAVALHAGLLDLDLVLQGGHHVRDAQQRIARQGGSGARPRCTRRSAASARPPSRGRRRRAPVTPRPGSRGPPRCSASRPAAPPPPVAWAAEEASAPHASMTRRSAHLGVRRDACDRTEACRSCQ